MKSLGEVLDRLEEECERSNWKYHEAMWSGGDTNASAHTDGTSEEERSNDRRTIHVESLRTVLGRRAFGPILLVSGLFCITPVGVVPGVPSTLAIVVLIVSVQHTMGRETLWLPGFILRRRLTTRRVARSVAILRHVARPVDRVFRERFSQLVDGVGARAVGVTTGFMAIFIPPLEFIPFSVTIPALALAGFGLGILTRDGLLLTLTFLFVVTAFVLLGMRVLS